MIRAKNEDQDHMERLTKTVLHLPAAAKAE